MLKIEFRTEGMEALHYERFHHPQARVQMKMEAVYLKSRKLAHQEICQLVGIIGNTLRSHLRDYKQGGIDRLKQLNFYQRVPSAIVR